MKTLNEIVKDLKSQKEDIEHWLKSVLEGNLKDAEKSKENQKQTRDKSDKIGDAFRECMGKNSNGSIIYTAIIYKRNDLFKALFETFFSLYVSIENGNEDKIKPWVQQEVEKKISRCLLKDIEQLMTESQKISEDFLVETLPILFAAISKFNIESDVVIKFLSQCKSKSYFKIMELFYKNQIKLPARALQFAIENRYQACVKAALNQELSEWAFDASNPTLLGLAVQQNDKIIVEDLLTQKLIREKINKQDHRGETPLHYAARNKNCDKKIILSLIRADADLHIPDLLQRTPQQLLLEWDDKEITDALIQRNKQLTEQAGLALALRKDKRLFAQSQNDCHLQGTHYEGGNLSNAFGLLSDFLKTIPSSSTQILRKKIDEMLKFQKTLDGILLLSESKYDRDKIIDPIIEQLISEIIKTLIQNRMVFIPGGWSSQTGPGHAVIYGLSLIEPRAKDSASLKQYPEVTFEIYNTGDGSQYHSRFDDRKKQRSGLKLCFAIPLPASEGISEQSLTKLLSSLLNRVIRYNLNEFWGSYERGHIELNGEKLYRNIMNKVFLLGGRLLASDSNLYITGQISGTCSFKVVTNWQKYQSRELGLDKTLEEDQKHLAEDKKLFEEDLYTKLKVSTLKWYDAHDLSNPHMSLSFKDQLFYAVNNLARRLLKQPKTNDEKLIETLKPIIALIKRIYPSYPFIGRPNIFPANADNRAVDELYFQIEKRQEDRYGDRDRELREGSLEMEKPEPLKPYHYAEAKPFSNFLSDMQALIAATQKIQDEARIQLIEMTLSNIPIGNRDHTDYFKNIRENACQNIFALLTVQRIYIEALHRVNQKKFFSSRILTFYTISTLACQLAKQVFVTEQPNSHIQDEEIWAAGTLFFFKEFDDILNDQLFYIENGKVLERFQSCRRHNKHPHWNQHRSSSFLSLTSIATTHNIKQEKLRQLAKDDILKVCKEHREKENSELMITPEAEAFYAFGWHLDKLHMEKPLLHVLREEINFYSLFRLILTEALYPLRNYGGYVLFGKTKFKAEDNLIQQCVQIKFNSDANPNSWNGDKRLYPVFSYSSVHPLPRLESFNINKILSVIHPPIPRKTIDENNYDEVQKEIKRTESIIPRFEFNFPWSGSGRFRTEGFKDGNALQVQILAKQRSNLDTEPRKARTLTEETSILRHLWQSRDIPSCQIMTTVLFFLEHLHLLENTDYQTFLTTNLFNYDAEHTLFDGANMDAILELIERAIIHYKDNDFLSSPISYLLKLNYFLASYIRIMAEREKQAKEVRRAYSILSYDMSDDENNKDNLDIMTTRLKRCEKYMGYLREWINHYDPENKKNLNEIQTINAYRAQCNLYYNLLQDIDYRSKSLDIKNDEKIRLDFLEAQFFLEMYKNREAEGDPILDAIQEKVQNLLAPAIENWYEKTDTKVLIEQLKLLNPSLKKAFTQFEGSWDKTLNFPLLSHKNAAGLVCHVDMMRGQLIQEGYVLQAMPSWLAKHRGYQRLFSMQDKPKALQVFGNRQGTRVYFEYFREQYCIQKKGGLFKNIKIQGRYYWCVQTEKQHYPLPDFFKYKDFIKWYASGHQEDCWVISSAESLNNEWIQFKSDLYSLDKDGVPLQKVQDFHYYQARDEFLQKQDFKGGIESGDSILVFMPSDTQILRLLYLRYGIEFQSQPLETPTPAPASASAPAFASAEKPTEYDEKTLKDSGITSNHALKSGSSATLSYIWKNEFELVLDQSTTLFPNYPHYFRLRSKNSKSTGITHIVLALQPFVMVGYKAISIDRKNQYLDSFSGGYGDRNDWRYKNQCQYFLIKLNAEGIPEPDNTEACLQLLYLYLGNRLFKKALATLDTFQRLGGFSGSRTEAIISYWILKHAFPYAENNNSAAEINAPEIAALQLQFLALLLRYINANNHFNLKDSNREGINADFYREETNRLTWFLSRAQLIQVAYRLFNYFIKVDNNVPVSMQLSAVDQYFLLMHFKPDTLCTPLLSRLQDAKEAVLGSWSPDVPYMRTLLGSLPESLSSHYYDYDSREICLSIPKDKSREIFIKRLLEYHQENNQYTRFDQNYCESLLEYGWNDPQGVFRHFDSIMKHCVSLNVNQKMIAEKKRIIDILEANLKTSFAMGFPFESLDNETNHFLLIHSFIGLYYVLKAEPLAKTLKSSLQEKKRAIQEAKQRDPYGYFHSISRIRQETRQKTLQQIIQYSDQYPLTMILSIRTLCKSSHLAREDRKKLNDAVPFAPSKGYIAESIFKKSLDFLPKANQVSMISSQNLMASSKENPDVKHQYEGLNQREYEIGRRQNLQAQEIQTGLFHRLAEHDNLKQFSNNLQRAITGSETRITKIKDKIVCLLRKLPEHETLRLFAELEILAGKKALVGVPNTVLLKNNDEALKDELRILYLKNNLQSYQDCTYLSLDEIQTLHSKIGLFLLEDVYLVHYKTCLAEVQKIMSSGLSDVRQNNRLARMLYEEQPERSLSFNPLRAFASSEKIILRTLQLDILEKLLPKPDQPKDQFPNIIFRLNMGEGKTTVIIPLLEHLKAMGRNLVVFIVTRGLFQSFVKDNAQIFYRGFRQSIVPFQFTRQTHQKSSDLRQMFNLLLDVMLSKKAIVSTNLTFPSIDSSWLALLRDGDDSEETAMQVLIMEGILDLTSKYGDAYFEEIDSTGRIRDELNYAVGTERPIQPEILDWFMDLVTIFSKIQLRYKDTRLTVQDLAKGRLKDMPVEEQQQWLSEIMVPAVAHFLVRDLSSPLRSLVSRLSENEKMQLIQHLSKQKGSAFNFQGLTHRESRLVKLYHSINAELFPVVFMKKSNVDFGYSKNQNLSTLERMIAIPYSEGRPCEQSKFGDHLETALYTALLLIEFGVPHIILDKPIESYQNKARREKTYSFGRIQSLSDTKAAEELIEITGFKTSVIQDDFLQKSAAEELSKTEKEKYKGFLINLNVNDKKQLDELSKFIDPFHPSLNHYCLRQLLLTIIKIHLAVIRNTVLDHQAQYRSVQGGSGSIQSPFIFDERTQFDERFSEGTEGRILDLLLSKNIPVVTSSDNSAIRSIKNILALEPKARALIDVGSLLNGISREQVAHHLADFYNQPLVENAKQASEQDQSEKIKYILYFNEEDQLTALDIGKKTKIVIGTTEPKIIEERLGVSPQQYFVYYDKVRTRGTNIRLANFAIGIVTFSGVETIAEVTQGAARPRELQAKQNIIVLLSYELSQLHPELKDGLVKILPIAGQNQNLKTLDENFRALNLKMVTKIKQDLKQCIRSKNHPNHREALKRKKELYQIFSDMLETPIHDDPHYLPTRSEEQPIADYIEHEQGRILNAWKTMRQNAGCPVSLKEDQSFTEFFKRLGEKALPICPKNVKAISTNRMIDTEVQYVTVNIDHQQNLEKDVKESIEQQDIKALKQKIQFVTTLRDTAMEVVTEAQSHRMVEQNLEQRANQNLKTSIELRTELEQQVFSTQKNVKPVEMQFPSFVNINDLPSLYIKSELLLKSLLSRVESKHLPNKPIFDCVAMSNLQWETHGTSSTFFFDCYTKAIYYILFFQTKNRNCFAIAITQLEASVLSQTLERKNKDKQGRIYWISNTQELIFAGKPPKMLAANYFYVLEQMAYLDGNTEFLAKNVFRLEWLWIDLIKKLNFYERTILACYPDKRAVFPEGQLKKVLFEYLSDLYQIIKTALYKQDPDRVLLTQLIIQYMIEEGFTKEMIQTTEPDPKRITFETDHASTGQSAAHGSNVTPNASNTLIFSTTNIRNTGSQRPSSAAVTAKPQF